jgi:hypothetical protein
VATLQQTDCLDDDKNVASIGVTLNFLSDVIPREHSAVFVPPIPSNARLGTVFHKKPTPTNLEPRRSDPNEL